MSDFLLCHDCTSPCFWVWFFINKTWGKGSYVSWSLRSFTKFCGSLFKQQGRENKRHWVGNGIDSDMFKYPVNCTPYLA